MSLPHPNRSLLAYQLPTAPRGWYAAAIGVTPAVADKTRAVLARRGRVEGKHFRFVKGAK